MRTAHTLPAPLLWTLLFVAVLAHLPALASYFALDDWDYLARGAGQQSVEGWPVRAFSTVVIWKLLWPVFGMNAVAYHALALLLVGACAVLTARVALRLGLGSTGAATAGLVMAATPVAILPVAWASATAELWAAVFALAALDLWLGRRGGFTPFVALATAVLSLLSKESGLFLAPLFALALLAFGPPEAPQIRRARWTGLVLLAAVALAVALQVWRAFAHGPTDPYALSGPRDWGRHLLGYAGWMAWPWRHPFGHGAAVLLVGAGVWLSSICIATWRWRRGRRDGFFASLWTLASLLPALSMRDHIYPYYTLLAVSGWGWTLGIFVEALLEGRFVQHPQRRGFALVVAAVIGCGLGWAATSATMKTRGADGRLTNAVLRSGTVAAEIAATIRSIPSLEQREAVVILQATRAEIPEDLPLPAGTEIRVGSPLHGAIRGTVGLRLLLPEGVHGDWVTHLESLPPSTLVFLDAGEDQLRPLGDLLNARMYTALIAVSAGQFDRARHDLWMVLNSVGSQVRFAFDPQSLPIEPAHLDAESPAFARFLLQDQQPDSGPILKLFDNLYEAVRGQKLVRDPFEEPLRAPRQD